MIGRTRGVAALVALATGCGGPCDDVCPRLEDAARACVQNGEQSYDSLGFRDAADLAAWCDAWVLERRTLAGGGGDASEPACDVPDASLACATLAPLSW